MKKIRSLVMVLALVVLLSGCYDYKTEMVINNDKSVKLSVDMKIDTTMLKDFAGEGDDETTTEEETDANFDLISEEEIQKLKERGYTVAVNTEGNINTISVSKNFPNIDAISVEQDVKVVLSNLFEKDFDDSKFFKVIKKLGNKSYKANFAFESNEADQSMGDLSMYESMINLSYVVTLPEKSISNNATTVSEDGKTLTWKLSMSKANEINYEFQFANNNILIYAIGGVTLLALIGGVVLVIVKKNKKSSSITTNVNKI